MFLGFFLLPKDSYAVSSISEDTCCIVEKAQNGRDSCTPDKDCHSDGTEKGGRDCHNCHTCAFTSFIASAAVENTEAHSQLYFKSPPLLSFYLTPEFLDFTSKIWQPPKII